MRNNRTCLALFFCLLAAPLALLSQSPDEQQMRSAMQASADEWNRGNLEGFMQTYENSSETTFIGATVRKGFAPILERYRQAYSTPDQMGRLRFSEIEIRLLPDSCGKTQYASMTGKFHLQRNTHGAAAKDDGVFSLLWRHTAVGWRIILDHSS